MRDSAAISQPAIVKIPSLLQVKLDYPDFSLSGAGDSQQSGGNDSLSMKSKPKMIKSTFANVSR